jgi:hypothetical protein
MAKILWFTKSAPVEPAANPTVKFMWNGIKVGGKLYRAFYSDGEPIGRPVGTLTIYARDYNSFPKIEGLTVLNDSVSQSDCYCNDKIHVLPDNVHYAAVLEAIRLGKERQANKLVKRDTPKGKPVTRDDKIQVFAAAVEASELADLARMGCNSEANRRSVIAVIKPGKKYTKVDVGGSGKYMIDPEGNIFGIKGYGVVHLGKRYGTLDNFRVGSRYGAR